MSATSRPPAKTNLPSAASRSLSLAVASKAPDCAYAAASSSLIGAPQTESMYCGIVLRLRLVLEGTDLDGAAAGDRGFLGQRERFVQVSGVDDPETAHLFLHFGVRAIGHDDRARVGAHHAAAGLVDQAA